MKKTVRPPKSRRCQEKFQPDFGTPEQQQKRALLVQGGDPVLASSPLGVCYARKLIGRSDYFAGLKYAKLYRRCISRPTQARTANLTRRSRGLPPVDKKAEERSETTYRAVKNLLLKEGRAACRVTEAVTVFEQWPYFIQAGLTRANSGQLKSRELELLKQGLHRLVVHFGMESKSKAKIRCKLQS